jgi:hypothetical protein
MPHLLQKCILACVLPPLYCIAPIVWVTPHLFRSNIPQLLGIRNILQRNRELERNLNSLDRKPKPKIYLESSTKRVLVYSNGSTKEVFCQISLSSESSVSSLNVLNLDFESSSCNINEALLQFTINRCRLTIFLYCFIYKRVSNIIDVLLYPIASVTRNFNTISVVLQGKVGILNTGCRLTWKLLRSVLCLHSHYKMSHL